MKKNQQTAPGHKGHILWINSIADFKGGCERYCFDTAELLKTDGYTNTLLYDVEHWFEPSFAGAFDQAYPNVDIKRQIAELRPDIIYIHRINGTRLLNELKMTGIPVVRFFHDHKLFCLREHKYTAIGHNTCRDPVGACCYYRFGFINRSQKWPGIRFKRLKPLVAEQHINATLDGFVVGSEYMKQHLVAHGFSASRFLVNPLYYRMNHLNSAEPVKKSSNELLFVGQLVRGKGIDILLKALTKVPHDFKLTVCGSGRQENELKNLVGKLNLQSRVHFTGKLTPVELARYYEGAAWLVVPSRAPETFCLTGVEAMAHGTPVIAASVGGTGEWLKDGISGYHFPSGNIKALTSIITKVLANPETSVKMQKTALQHYETLFTPDKHIQKLSDYFQQIMGTK